MRIVEKDSGVVQSDTQVIWCESGICEERAADGATVTRRAFTQGEQIAGMARFFAADHLGSVGEVTNDSSTLLARYAYDPTGRRSITAGTDVTKVGYTGHAWQANGGLWLTQFRGYDAGPGRWISQDPLGIRGGLNLHAYVSGNPLHFVDPLGLKIACRASIRSVDVTATSCAGNPAGCTRANGRLKPRDAKETAATTRGSSTG